MNSVKWLFADEPVEERMFLEIETFFGVKFPADYEHYILKYDGAYPKPNAFEFGERVGIFNNLLSFRDDSTNIKEVYKCFSSSLPKKIIPFGRDPFGNLICFDYRKGEFEPVVVFFDHEAKGEEAVYPICNTFTELLDKLYFSKDEE